MSEPFVGQIMMAGFNFVPRGYAFCNGQLLNVQQNQILFALLGTSFGGDGRTTFGLPDLQGRAPLGRGKGTASAAPYLIASKGGVETVTLTQSQMPSHTHAVAANTASGIKGPVDNVFGKGNTEMLYVPTASAGTMVALNPATVSTAGGGGAHTNMQPFLSLNFAIALTGIFPARP